MKESEMLADFYCIHCLDDTPHKILYINDEISKVECEHCHHALELKVDLMEEFWYELYQRIVNKPKEITKEYKQDLSKFLFSLPIRITSKPYRLLKELKETKKLMDKYKE